MGNSVSGINIPITATARTAFLPTLDSARQRLSQFASQKFSGGAARGPSPAASPISATPAERSGWASNLGAREGAMQLGGMVGGPTGDIVSTLFSPKMLPLAAAAAAVGVVDHFATSARELRIESSKLGRGGPVLPEHGHCREEVGRRRGHGHRRSRTAARTRPARP